MLLEDALFPTVALELVAPIYFAGGPLFAGAGAVILARGRERGTFNEVLLTNPHTRRTIGASLADVKDARVLDEIPG